MLQLSQCLQCHQNHFAFLSHHNITLSQNSLTITKHPHYPSLSLPKAIPPQFLASAIEQQDGPIELPPSTTTTPLFPTTTGDESSPLQLSLGLLITGAVAVILFRSLRRRAKKAKELKFRSSGENKTVKEEALDSLKTMQSAPITADAPPSPVQALLGGISAGVIALILYQFTTTVEAGLNRQPLSDNFSVRQITVTIRTIINGICYLATFVFGLNSIGLFLYSCQLALDSMTQGSTQKEATSKGGESSGSSKSMAESVSDSSEMSNIRDDQSSDDTQ